MDRNELMNENAADGGQPNGKPLASRPVAVQRALEVFSDNWSFAVLQELFFGVKYFEDFHDNLGISRSVLSRRLKRLTAQGVVARVPYQHNPPRFEYRLTESGKAMYPFFVMLRHWGEQWLDVEGANDQALVHKTCHNLLDPVLVCGNCLKRVDAQDVEVFAASTGKANLPAKPE